MSEDAKQWCAMCGKWTDHQSGRCPELHPNQRTNVMSETPRTDAAWKSAFRHDHISAEAVRDFAKTLELENARLREALNAIAFHLRRNDHTNQPTGQKCTEQILGRIEALTK